MLPNNQNLNDLQLPQIIRAVQRGVRWLKESAERLTEEGDTRDIAITVSALVAAERNPHSHLVQRLVSMLLRRQAANGSWSDELWDTTWAAKALHDVGYRIDNPILQAAVRFFESTQDPLTGTWYEEPFETILVLDILARIAPQRFLGVCSVPLRWLGSLQNSQGMIVGTRYTGMTSSLFVLARKLGIGNIGNIDKIASKCIRLALEHKPIWTSAAWSNYYPLRAMLDQGETLDDPLILKAVSWFLSVQDEDGKWFQVSRVHDTAMAVLILSDLLTTPVIDVSAPHTGILNATRENGTIRVTFHSPGAGAITPAEKVKLSEQVRLELSRNQQLLVAAAAGFRKTRSSVSNQTHPETVHVELEKIGRYAYGHLIPARIQLHLNGSPADHLRLDIDERLIDLPWELIHDGFGFLCLRYAVGRRLLTEQTFIAPKVHPRTAENTRVLVVADPTSDLPAAKNEGREVAELLRKQCKMQVSEFVGSEISKKDFLLSLKDYDIVHYAGHTSHDPASPDESCLMFFDGEIQACEIGRFLGNRSPSVVFLNSCWSAEELRNPNSYSPMMRGLGRTFLYAGVTAFIGYLIPVPDLSATSFAISFYQALAEGQSIGEALRRARILCRDCNKPDDLTWSSAVLYGDPAARPIGGNP